MKSSIILTIIGIAGIMLVMGTALGAVAFPITKTETTTFLTSVTLTQSKTLTHSSSAMTPSLVAETIDTCSSQIILNATHYCSLDVTNFTSIGVPGRATMNRSVRFVGVLFQTICEGNIGSCGTITET